MSLVASKLASTCSRRPRPRAVARAGAGADSRRTGDRRRPGRLEGRHAGRRRRAASSWPRRIIRTSAAAASSSRTRSTPSASTSAGRRALDIGASTGGFTDVLLQRGAASVIALDVGHGQLDWRLRTDPRVLVREGVNARALATTTCRTRPIW